MKRYDRRLIKDIVLLIVLLIIGIAVYSYDAKASDLRLLEARELSFSAYKLETYIDPYYYDRTTNKPYYGQYDDSGDERLGEYWAYGVAMDANMDLVKYGNYTLLWDNKVSGDATNNQYRHVSWEYYLAMNFHEKIELFWDHESRHHLESTEQNIPYPLKDLFGVKMIFFKR